MLLLRCIQWIFYWWILRLHLRSCKAEEGREWAEADAELTLAQRVREPISEYTSDVSGYLSTTKLQM